MGRQGKESDGARLKLDATEPAGAPEIEALVTRMGIPVRERVEGDERAVSAGEPCVDDDRRVRLAHELLIVEMTAHLDRDPLALARGEEVVEAHRSAVVLGNLLLHEVDQGVGHDLLEARHQGVPQLSKLPKFLPREVL